MPDEDRPDVPSGSYWETTESSTGWAEAVVDLADGKKKWKPRPAPIPPLPSIGPPPYIYPPTPPLPPLPVQ